jgi:hypothetical protein
MVQVPAGVPGDSSALTAAVATDTTTAKSAARTTCLRCTETTLALICIHPFLFRSLVFQRRTSRESRDLRETQKL